MRGDVVGRFFSGSVRLRKPVGKSAGCGNSVLRFCLGRAMLQTMDTMNVSLPDSLKAFVEEQVDRHGYGNSAEYVRELIQREQDRSRLRDLLIAGASSPPGAPVDQHSFEILRRSVRDAGAERSRITLEPPSAQ